MHQFCELTHTSEKMETFMSASSHETSAKIDALKKVINPNSSNGVDFDLEKYPSLLEVPFISETELLLTRQVGSGSFGHVYHGILFSQDVAVKRLTVRNFTDDLEFFEIRESDDQKARQLAKTLLALEKEVSIMKGLRFVNIVQFYGVCLKPAAIVTQYCSRGSLFDLIGNARSIRRIARELTWKRRIQLALDAAIGMNYLHARMDPVLHRDLKSPNLLVDEYFNCKVADFNTSCFIDQTIITDSIQANNPRWMAPEVAAGSPFSKAADVYPFGIILWELMTWREPFESDDEALRPIQILTLTVRDGYRPEIVPNHELQGGPCPVYEAYLELMKQCWHQDPEERPSFKEIIERLKELMTGIVQFTESANLSQERPSFQNTYRSPRATSPEPQPTHSPSRSSPFSRPRSPQITQQSNKLGVGIYDAQVELSQGEDTFSCSPFMNGPPLSDAGEGSPKANDKQLDHPPSFARWSSQIDDQDVGSPSPKGEEEKRTGKQLWNILSSDFFQLEVSNVMQDRRSEGMAHWDSLRTLIFGDRGSDRFIERFSNFVLGDESELTESVAKATKEQKTPAGLKVLKAMMELEQKEEQKERDRWSIVKHLMLENLKSSSRHPLWRVLAKSLNNAQSIMEALTPIQEPPPPPPPPAKKSNKGLDLWKRVQVHFNLEDYSPTTPLRSPYWSVLRDLFFEDSDEEEELNDHPPMIPEEAPMEGTSEETKTPCARAMTNWGKVKRQFDFKNESSWDRNRDFLKRFAQEQHPEILPDSPQFFETCKPRSRGWDRIRKLLIVDEKPPSEDKWKFVREYLMENDFGRDWDKLSTFVKSHPQPPKEGHWDRFRRLFFENRNLREQSQWSFLKDLFLKQDGEETFQILNT